MEPRLAFPVRCPECFGEVFAELRQHNYETTIFVALCITCVQRETKEAYWEGAQSAEQTLFQDGFDQGKRAYEDDVRAAVLLTQEVCDEIDKA
jgi:hypothetical protein